MNIAVVGCGIRCAELLHIAEQHEFEEIHPNIVAVADIEESTPGFVLAKKKGLYVTKDYKDFFVRDDIDLIKFSVINQKIVHAGMGVSAGAHIYQAGVCIHTEPHHAGIRFHLDLSLNARS